MIKFILTIILILILFFNSHFLLAYFFIHRWWILKFIYIYIYIYYNCYITYISISTNSFFISLIQYLFFIYLPKKYENYIILITYTHLFHNFCKGYLLKQTLWQTLHRIDSWLLLFIIIYASDEKWIQSSCRRH